MHFEGFHSCMKSEDGDGGLALTCLVGWTASEVKVIEIRNQAGHGGTNSSAICFGTVGSRERERAIRLPIISLRRWADEDEISRSRL